MLITRIDPTEGVPFVEVRELMGVGVRSDWESEACRWTSLSFASEGVELILRLSVTAIRLDSLIFLPADGASERVFSLAAFTIVAGPVGVELGLSGSS